MRIRSGALDGLDRGDRRGGVGRLDADAPDRRGPRDLGLAPRVALFGRGDEHDALAAGRHDRPGHAHDLGDGAHRLLEVARSRRSARRGAGCPRRGRSSSPTRSGARRTRPAGCRGRPARRGTCAGRPRRPRSSIARSRPVDPPSSATETTPVTSSVSARSARSDTAVPWPPPTATTLIERCRGERRRGRGAGDGGAPRRSRPSGGVPRCSPSRPTGRTCPPSANAGICHSSSVDDVVQEVLGRLLAEHVRRDWLVESRERAQRLDPVGVGQEAAVKDEVDVARQAVRVAEGDQRDAHRTRWCPSR